GCPGGVPARTPRGAMSRPTPGDAPPKLVIRRLLPAPPAEVFAAWTDPSSLARWMSPYGSASATLDLRVGGAFQIVMRGLGRAITHPGRYREIDPPRRLVFTWRSDHTDGDSVVTVVLRDLGAETELELTRERLPEVQRDSH